MYDYDMRIARRVLVPLLVTVLLFWAGAVGFLWANEARFVYRTNWTRGWATADEPRLGEPFTLFALLSSGDLRLDAVTLEHDTAADRYWIVYFNGAAGSIQRSGYRGHLEQLHRLGYNVLSFDYRGFGRSGGSPTEAGIYDDGLAAYRHLTGNRGVDPSRVILAGRSLGSAVAVELATRVPSAGVVLLSPIDSVPRVGARIYWWAPVSLLARSRFDSLSKISRVEVPIVIAHARNDRFVPIEAGRSL